MQPLHGFIMLHRRLLDWEWYTEATVARVFIHLLLTASFRPARWNGIEIMPGQVVTSIVHIAEQLGLSVQQVRTALKKLQSTGEIIVKATNKYTLITLVKWGFYQAAEENATNEQQTNNKPATNEQQHRNNVHNVNNVNKKNAYAGLQIYNSGKYDYEEISRRSRELIRERIGKTKDTA